MRKHSDDIKCNERPVGITSVESVKTRVGSEKYGKSQSG